MAADKNLSEHLLVEGVASSDFEHAEIWPLGEGLHGKVCKSKD